MNALLSTLLGLGNSPKALRFAALCVALATLAGSSRADITWTWEYATESGTFRTDGNLVGDTAPAGTYHVFDFTVDQSFDSINLGSMSGGQWNEGAQPGTGFVWDGTTDTQWFRGGGTFTNGANYFRGSTQVFYLFHPATNYLHDETAGVTFVSSPTKIFAPDGVGADAGFCFGDGTSGPCPCNNNSSVGHDEGCLNSQARGAALSAFGSRAVVRDNLGFRVVRARPGQPGLLIQGETQIALPFRDGLLCMGNPTERIEVMLLDTTGAASSTSSIATEGAVIPGVTRYYQYWFRDPVIGTCGSGSNTSNGVVVNWI